MLEKEVVFKKIQELEGYIVRLDEFKDITLDRFRESIDEQWKIEHGLQLAIQCILDTANYIISSLNLKKPNDYREAIVILGEVGVLPGAYADKIQGIAGFRNILIHEYTDLDLDAVYNNFEKAPSEFKEFIGHIADFLEKRKD